MKIHKLDSTNAFVAVDLENAPGRGVIRVAPKILQGGAKDLARSMTYALASLGLKETGVSAGISTTPESKEDAVTAFVNETKSWQTQLSFTAGKGITEEEIGISKNHQDSELLAFGAVTAALAFKPDSLTAVIDDPNLHLKITELLSLKGIEVMETDDPMRAEADLLFCGSKVGAIDHEIADKLSFAVVVPTAPLPITTRAVASCQRNGIAALPDFVTTIGSLVKEETKITKEITSIIAEISDHQEGPLIGACERAELFLATWQKELPFGRPMAS
tara:strand:- start:56 stop:880 length:825 start_codon:yes stop_codon:yes gene_type:complete